MKIFRTFTPIADHISYCIKKSKILFLKGLRDIHRQKIVCHGSIPLLLLLGQNLQSSIPRLLLGKGRVYHITFVADLMIVSQIVLYSYLYV